MSSINKNQVLLYGASGHAKVISSILESNSIIVNAIFDDFNDDALLNKYKIIYKYKSDYKPEFPMLISIGDNKIRKRVSANVSHSFTMAIHPSSIIDDVSKIGSGSVIFQSAIIQRDALIGRHCIINTNSSVDHDCMIEDFVHVSPSATLCGNVFVGEGTHIGAGATVIPNIKIGKWCIIGAGAVIISDIPDNSVVVGNPGRIIKCI